MPAIAVLQRPSVATNSIKPNHRKPKDDNPSGYLEPRNRPPTPLSKIDVIQPNDVGVKGEKFNALFRHDLDHQTNGCYADVNTIAATCDGVKDVPLELRRDKNAHRSREMFA